MATQFRVHVVRVCWITIIILPELKCCVALYVLFRGFSKDIHTPIESCGNIRSWFHVSTRKGAVSIRRQSPRYKSRALNTVPAGFIACYAFAIFMSTEIVVCDDFSLDVATTLSDSTRRTAISRYREFIRIQFGCLN